MNNNNNNNNNNNKKEKDERIWGILLFGVIGATVTTAAIMQLRNAAGLVYSQVSRQSSRKGKAGTNEWARNDWYWHGDPFNGTGSYGGANYYREAPKSTRSHSLSHHYSVLGLHRTRAQSYTDNEIKSAFRAKALKFHPDQNKDNKEAAEVKFKEVMTSYEAIKMERKNT